MNEKNENQIDNKNEDDKKLEELLNEYIIDKTWGEGNFGKVKLAIHKMTKEKVSKLIYLII